MEDWMSTRGNVEKENGWADRWEGKKTCVWGGEGDTVG